MQDIADKYVRTLATCGTCDSDEELDAQCDVLAACRTSMIDAKAATVGDAAAKGRVLAHWLDNVEGWDDGTASALVRSLVSDLDRLNRPTMPALVRRYDEHAATCAEQAELIDSSDAPLAARRQTAIDIAATPATTLADLASKVDIFWREVAEPVDLAGAMTDESVVRLLRSVMGDVDRLRAHETAHERRHGA
jgi:hypothetical protein